jgi:CheY-like chemotaxis protein
MSTILCIDNNLDMLKTRRMVLESAGYVVRTAADQAEAVGALKAGSVHCVIVRHSPPATHATQIAKRIRKLYPRVPIILLSPLFPNGSAEYIDEQVFNLDGPETLLRAVARALGKRVPPGRHRLQEEELSKNLRRSLELYESTKQLRERVAQSLRRTRKPGPR